MQTTAAGQQADKGAAFTGKDMEASEAIRKAAPEEAWQKPMMSPTPQA